MPLRSVNTTALIAIYLDHCRPACLLKASRRYWRQGSPLGHQANELSFLPQCSNRIDACGSPSWDKARDNCDGAENNRRTREGERVGGAYAEEHFLEYAG